MYVCHHCFLVQVQEYVSPEAIFREYAYFSSYSDSWLAHVKGYVNMITARLGLTPASQVASFTEQVHETKRRLLEFLIAAKRRGKRIAGYGAPGKGNTLLNYCGIGRDFLDYTVDRNPYKQGKFLPGTHLPIYPPETLRATRPDYVLILAWNLKDEIMEQVADIRSWGGQFLVPIPDVKVYP